MTRGGEVSLAPCGRGSGCFAVSTPPQDLSITPLMVAARDGDARVCETLLGAQQVLEQDAQGRIALVYAAINGHLDCIRQLLRVAPREQMTTPDKCGETAVLKALQGKHQACVDVLLAAFLATRERDTW